MYTYTQEEKQEMHDSVKNLIYKLAYRHAGIIPLEEMINIGNFAVQKALLKWDGKRSKFSHFCFKYIRGFMLDAVKEYRKVNVAFVDNLVVEGPSPFTEANTDEWWEDILHPLDERQKTILTLWYRDGLTLDDIVKRLKLSNVSIMKIRDQAFKEIWLRDRDRRIHE